MPIDETTPSVLDRAADVINDAADAVQKTTQNFAQAIEVERRPGGLIDRVAIYTRQSPIRSLAIAFLLGAMFSRRR